MTPKRKLANKMLTPQEKSVRVNPFESKAWVIRNAQVRLRVIKQNKRAVIRRLEREIAKDKGEKVKYSIK